MTSNQRAIRHTLEVRLTQALPTRLLRESILIHRFADPVEGTQQAWERDFAIQTLDRDSTLAKRIQAAMARLDDGSYGECIECGHEIAVKRLTAIPWAEFCIGCQEIMDHAEARQDFHASERKLRPAA